MRFAAVALMGAVYLTDLIEGRRTSQYVVTRATCEGYAWEESEGPGRRLGSDELKGRVNISQVTNGDEMGTCRIWSHWRNIPESDSYDIVMMSAQDCTGTEEQKISAAAMSGNAPGSMNLTGEFSADAILADLADTCSIGLKDADGQMFACCNLELKDRAKDERDKGDAPRHGRVRGPNNNKEKESEGEEEGESEEGGECEGEEGCFNDGEKEAEGTSGDRVDSMDEESSTTSDDDEGFDGGDKGDEGDILPGLLGDEGEADVEVESESTMEEDTFEDEDTQSEDTAADEKEAEGTYGDSVDSMDEDSPTTSDDGEGFDGGDEGDKGDEGDEGDKGDEGDEGDILLGLLGDEGEADVEVASESTMEEDTFEDEDIQSEETA